MVNSAQSKFVVIGNPVMHSLSPVVHAAFAQQFNLAINYSRVELRVDQVITYIRNFFAGGGKGVNITTPFKQLVYAAGFQNSARAHEARAVNCLLLDNNRQIIADNTDGIGFIRDLTIRHKFKISGSNILILGAGGATRGIIQPLIQMSPNKIMIANRNIETAKLIKSSITMPELVEIVAYEEISNFEYDLVINATSASLQQQLPPIPKNFNFRSTTCYDLNYSRKNGDFLDLAMKNGALKIIDGLGMLIEQAAEAFYLWNNLMPNTSLFLEDLHHSTDHISAFDIL